MQIEPTGATLQFFRNTHVTRAVRATAPSRTHCDKMLEISFPENKLRFKREGSWDPNKIPVHVQEVGQWEEKVVLLTFWTNNSSLWDYVCYRLGSSILGL